MMTDAPTGHFQSIVLQPHAGQFVIDELPAIVLCCAAWVYGGMEGLPLTALAVSVAALLSLALLYRFIYLRRTRYHMVASSLSAGMGCCPGRRTTWNNIVSWTLWNTKASCSSFAA